MKFKRILTLGLSLLLTVSFAFGCGGKDDDGDTADVSVKLWSAPTTQKIMRDREYPEYNDCVLNYQMAKNEIEGAQVIITPTNDYKVDSFDVTVSDLKTESGDVISKDSVAIYLQKYVRIDKQINYNNAYGAGYQPDPILPFDVAKEYGENTVTGVNQGIYVTVETESDTPAGDYVGSLTINIDGKDFNVPMQVEVWDFAISDEVHTRTVFSIWNSYFMNDEMDCTLEMQEVYSEALKQNRLSPLDLVFDERSTDRTEFTNEFIKAAKVATEDVRVTSYRMPPYLGEGYSADATQIRTNALVQIVKASTEDCCLIDKLIFYFGSTIDEPQFTHTEQLVNPCVESVQESAEKTIAQLESEGWFNTVSPEFAEHVKEKLRTTPMILTGPYETFYIDGGLTYCPLFDQFSTEEQRAIYQEQREKNGEVWWYGCTGPCYPWVTYHIDDHLLGARVLNWMMYDYGIDGNLYWCVNAYKVDGRTEDMYDRVDPTYMNGDGYLFYPGVDYGMDTPVSTLRLETIRDGMEDYEYFYELEKLTTGLSEYYGEEVSANAMLQPLFQRLYTNVNYNVDNENFFNVRSEIADIMERCSSQEKFVLKGVEYAGENATVKFNVADGYTVKVNGDAVTGVAQGQGKTYSKTIKLDKQTNVFEITVEKNGEVKTVTVDAGAKTVIAADFTDSADVTAVVGNGDNITVSKVAASEWAGADDAAKVEVVSTFDPSNPLETLTYSPEVSIAISSIGLTPAGLSTIRIQVYNDSGMPIKVRLVLKASVGEYEFINKELATGWNTLSVEGIEKSGWTNAGNVTRIVLRLDNTVDGKNQQAMPLQTLYLGEILAAYAN